MNVCNCGKNHLFNATTVMVLAPNIARAMLFIFSEHQQKHFQDVDSWRWITFLQLIKIHFCIYGDSSIGGALIANIHHRLVERIPSQFS